MAENVSAVVIAVAAAPDMSYTPAPMTVWITDELAAANVQPPLVPPVPVQPRMVAVGGVKPLNLKTDGLGNVPPRSPPAVPVAAPPIVIDQSLGDERGLLLVFAFISD